MWIAQIICITRTFFMNFYTKFKYSKSLDLKKLEKVIILWELLCVCCLLKYFSDVKNSFQKAINLILYNLTKMMSKVQKNVLNSDINKIFMECNRIHFFYMSKLQPKECLITNFIEESLLAIRMGIIW